MDPNNAENHVIELIDDAIGTNLTANERINKKEQLLKILRYLSWNIGKVISFNELGKHVGVDNETAERYVKLFEKAGLLYLLPSYSSDKRYELKKSHVVYFADNGIRNGLIRSFQAFDFRIDQQELWKNWVISERMKALKNSNKEIKSYFWNTHTKQEIDLIEVESNQLTGYKIYWDKKNKLKIPSLFESYYPTCKVSGINRSTFWNFIR
jgi:predicted AAA+ superfamily ATPase